MHQRSRHVILALFKSLGDISIFTRSPVVMRTQGGDPDLPWKLLGVHSSRMDVGSRDLQLDESLGLNCAWYADILLTLKWDGPH